MSVAFHPQNDLERDRMAVQEGRIRPKSFIQKLIGSEVIMSVDEKHQIGGFVTHTKATPPRIQTGGAAKCWYCPAIRNTRSHSCATIQAM